MKAKPAIDAVESIIKNLKSKSFQVILPSPSKEVFTQKVAHSLSKSENIIFVCTRYEGIDFRFEQYMKKKHPKQFQKISL